MNTLTIKVFAPATISNIGPGFDVLGLAIDQPGDIVTASTTREPGLSFYLKNQHTDLPNDKKNVAAHVAKLMLDEFKPSFGVSLILEKNMPLGSGLGSSGASSAAAAFAVNHLLAKPLPTIDLVRFAAEGERLACGTPHADNVAPSLLGGLCLIRSYSPLDIVQLPYQNTFYWVVASPTLSILTKDARDLLPKTISLAMAIEQNGNLATLITGLHQGDKELIRNSLKDNFAEPVRAQLIPGYNDIKNAALNAGAIGFSISGSGPAVFAIASDKHAANAIASAISSAFMIYAHADCRMYISRINQTGATILEESA
jgi:homoserine kinase